MLNNAITKKPDALGFAALDSKAAAPLLDQAKSANIPVVAFDSGVDSDIPVATTATDNKAAAAEAAKHMSQLLGGKGTVAMVVHDQTSKSGIDRRDGFIDWMKANAPGITLLPVQYGAGDQAKSADITKSIIQAHPEVAGIYGSNEGSAIGVVKGVQESGKKGIVVVGFDSGQAAVIRDQRTDVRLAAERRAKSVADVKRVYTLDACVTECGVNRLSRQHAQAAFPVFADRRLSNSNNSDVTHGLSPSAGRDSGRKWHS